MLILLVYGFIVIHMSIVWCIYRYLRNPSVIDVGWASGLTLSGLIYLFCSPYSSRISIFGGLLLLWGARLGIYLWYTRIRLGHVDKRYLSLSANWKIAKPLGFFLNFQLQGLLILIMSTPWYLSYLLPVNELLVTDYFGMGLVLIGLIGETTADNQLYQFKRNLSAKVCNIGLWQYSRHPNYFCEWLIWSGFAFFGFTSLYGLTGIISPVFLYFLMTKVTGPMTEEGSIKSRGEAYKEYQKNTPMFFPKIIL